MIREWDQAPDFKRSPLCDSIAINIAAGEGPRRRGIARDRHDQPHEVAYETEVVAMGYEPERQLVKVLTNIIDELKDLQAAGRMRDSESRAHIDFLERGLRHAKERVASKDVRERDDWWSSGDRRRMVS